ncbi:MAG: (d)CMP kinase [Candidatus Pacebacteria bacterium]|nr:(d)CMP kinase [Candidatus Paceibacterota bacterium]
MKKEIITICGSLGSGKSSTAKKVAGALGYRHFSSGDFFRQVGLELGGLSINETNIRAETDPNIDAMTDQKVRDMGKENKVVIDSRTAYHWIPESFKIYLDLPPSIARSRIFQNIKEDKFREQSEQISSEEEVYKKMQERFESEQARFLKLYNIDNTKKPNFDLIIDTNKNNLEQVVDIILTEYKKWLEN